MNETLTIEQRAAISSRGKVIVSASAGSGKTFVMIERLVSLILSGTDVKKILAVTFTNRAAAQMKDRLRRALIARLGEADKEERIRLKAQLSALPMAEISTIHSFCARLVRTYFYLADAESNFSIISEDSAEGALLFSRALNETFEYFYNENDAAFQKLLGVYFHKKKDAKLRRLVTQLYSSVRGLTDYRSILENAGKVDNFECVCAYIYGEYISRAEILFNEAKSLYDYFPEKDKARAVCADLIISAQALLKATDLFSLREAAQGGISVSRMPASTKYESEGLKKLIRLKNISEELKELYKDLKEYSSREEEYARYQDGQELSAGLASLVLKYDEICTRMKREAGVLDYNDLEHFALRFLENEEVCAAVREKYEFVFVDEYQDVNPAQEKILSLIGGEEIFLVGDAKQSIYGFRGSRSEFFLQKEKAFGSSLVLTENFRSSPAVLEAVNRVFSRAMTERDSGINYRQNPMRGGQRYNGHDGKVRFYSVPKAEKEKTEREVYSLLKEVLPEKDAQAELICDLIEQEVGSEWFDADEGIVKRVTFGDIAVLVRKTTGDAERAVAALSRRNIPVSTTANVNVCDFWEARLIIDWLSYLDNPEQDIPLAGALLSRIGGFTEAELAMIRENFNTCRTFRDACRHYAEKFEDTVALKLKTFFQKAEHYRALMQVRSSAEMANLLLSDGLEAEIAAKKDGSIRLCRVRRLISEGEGSVNDFLRRLKATDYCVDYAENSGEDAVKVLTMHSAKGLEYPVVILASLNAPFHGPDRADVLFTDQFSFAPKSYDTEQGIVRETVLRRASALYLEKEERKGELNLFYVAMTRAKFRLHMIFGKAENDSVLSAGCFADFVDFDDCADYFAQIDGAEREPYERQALAYRPDEALKSAILAEFQRPYAHAESITLPVKSSATQLMEHAEKEYHKKSASGVHSSVEEGLAYHAFLQHADFSKTAEEELSRMEREGLLSDEQLKILQREKLEKILSLPALRALKHRPVLREQRFLVTLPACEVMPTGAKDEILLQGAIDLLYQDEDGWLILDYKYSARSGEELKSTYSPQIALYRKAVARTLQIDERTVRAKIINILRLEEIDL